MVVSLPKPQFNSCDETSLHLKWDEFNLAGVAQLKLQYKEPHLDWPQAMSYAVPLESGAAEGVSLTEADVVDLKPGTAYFVRLQAVDSDGNEVVGPETVFDTQPIDCTPKKKRCVVS